MVPYLSVLADFRADVRKIAREQKGEERLRPAQTRSDRLRPAQTGSLKDVFSLSDGAAAAVRPCP